MISILIPVNNYDIIALVESMKRGLESVPEFGEILVGDDGSSDDYRNKYLALQSDKVSVFVSKTNIGRAAIRNKLVSKAQGDHLLIIDADSMIPATAEAYLQKWIPYLGKSKVISGGVLYRDSPPGDPDKLLRWKYGKKKEQLKASDRNKHPHATFTTFNVLIEKSVFSKLRFNEELKQYGHEDTLFGYQLKKAGIGVLHIDNGLIHEGLESNSEFLNKTKLGMENLSKLYDIVTDRKAFSSSVKMLRFYHRLDLLGVTRILARLYIKYRDKIENRLDSSDISLSLFNFYRISMFCTFREIHRRKKKVSFF